MNSDLSDDDQSNRSRTTTGRYRMPWSPNGAGRSMGTASSSIIPPLTNSATSTMQTNKTQSVGLSDPKLADARRRKLDAINKLSSLGAHRDIDLPQIVVIGSQSAGKSSLIESISGITLPRASGTCTRCPTECRLIHSNDQWQCAVSLRFMTDESGLPLNPVKNIQFGALIKDRKQVEDRLRRAQRAILNPSVEPQRFLDTIQPSQNNALAFSTNYVSLQISGPDVTDLSFVDLPGLINSVADGGRDEDVEEVKELVSSYIQKQSCIILLTVACESDFETQGAYRLAKQYDKEGVRTIGVLTKPDRIPEGEEGRWIQLIKNEVAKLQNGWFSVKQPSSIELQTGLTFQVARQKGEEFFKFPPWSTLDTVYRKQLGTQALTLKLNEFLMAVISKRIPEIMQELQRMLQKTKEELQKLPKPSSQDPVLELMHIIGNFSDDLYRRAEGFGHEPSGNLGPLSESNHFRPIDREQSDFRQTIRATAPNFRPFNANVELPVSEVSAGYRQPTTPGDPEYEPDFLEPEEGEKICSLQEVIYRDEVVRRVHDATTRELPGYYPFQVVQDLISCSTSCWDAPALALVDKVHDIVTRHQNKLVDKYFAHYTEGGLGHTVSNIMHEYMQDRRDTAIKRVKGLLELEAHAFTTNKNYFNNYRRQFLGFYRIRQDPWWRHTRQRDVQQPPPIIQPWDANESALEIMATVRAYFHVAYKRVVDTVPLTIDNELVRVQKRGVQEVLASGLKITEDDGRQRCQRLLAEPAAVVALREELENRFKRLMAAQSELNSI